MDQDNSMHSIVPSPLLAEVLETMQSLCSDKITVIPKEKFKQIFNPDNLEETFDYGDIIYQVIVIFFYCPLNCFLYDW